MDEPVGEVGEPVDGADVPIPEDVDDELFGDDVSIDEQQPGVSEIELCGHETPVDEEPADEHALNQQYLAEHAWQLTTVSNVLRCTVN